MPPKLEYETFHTVKSYAKIYPKMTKIITYDQPILAKIPGYELRTTPKVFKTDSSNPLLLLDSLRRTKTRLSDLVLCNDFDLFCTFTFSHDRQNVSSLKTKMSLWLKNQNRRNNKFKYLIVPEFHKDGVSIHFHALFKGYTGPLVDSGHKRRDGRIVYNLPKYSHGFSTATRIDQAGQPLVSSYIKKYITKDMPHFQNKARYWCSQDLIRPKKVANPLLSKKQKKQPHEIYKTTGMTTTIYPQKFELTATQYNFDDC